MTIELNQGPGNTPDGTNADGTPTQHPMEKDGVDPWASDAEWLDTGGYDADVQRDIEIARELSGK